MTNSYNLDAIIDDLVSFDSYRNFEQNISLFLIALNKKETQIYKQESDDNTKNILFNSLKLGLEESSFKNREVINYDVITSKKNSHELVTVSDYPNIARKLDELNDENKHLTSNSGMDETNFRYYMVSLKTAKHSYKIFGNFDNIFKLKKKFLFGNLTNSKVKLSNSNNVVGFNKKISLLVIDDQYILINQATLMFESIFRMDTLFCSQAINILENNTKIRSVISDETLDNLFEKIKTGKRIAARFIKVTEDSERLKKTIDNIYRIEEIIDDENHIFHDKVKDVVYSDGKLSIPKGKEGQLLNAISDAFYHAVFSETDNVDGSRI